MSRAVEREQIRPAPPEVPPARPLRQALQLTAGIVLGLGVLAFIWLFARPLMLVAIGVVIGEALAPLVAIASRGLPRPVAIVLVYLSIAVILATTLWFALAPLAGQAQELVITLPDLIGQAEAWLEQNGERIGNLPLDSLAAQLQGLGGQLLALPVTVMSSLFDLLLVAFLSLYWLLAGPQLYRFTLSLFPEERRERVGEVLAELSRTVGGYVRGVGINVLLVTVVTFVALELIGLPFALVLAVIAGLLELIPILGPFISGAIIVSFALSQSVNTALLALAFFVVLQQVEGNLLTPMVMRSQTSIHPFLILVAIVLGAGAGGLLGVLVAIPLAGAIKVLVVEVLAPALRRRVGAEQEGRA
jgi:predicted PurR-regulated permease PerM